jgi:hypothetical protein
MLGTHKACRYTLGMFVSRVVDKVCACNLGRKNTDSYFLIRQCMSFVIAST